MYFTKTKTNMSTLFDDLHSYCQGDHPAFVEKFSIFGQEAQHWIKKAVENFDYCVYQPTKKGGFTETYPFYDYWIKQACQTFELALWHAYYAEGGRNAEKQADEAVEKFRNRFA
jgi:hypothetical protein